MNASPISGQLRRLFRRVERRAPQQPVCPWFGAFAGDAQRLAAELMPADRFEIFDPTGIAKGFRRHGDLMLNPTSELSVGWSLLNGDLSHAEANAGNLGSMGGRHRRSDISKLQRSSRLIILLMLNSGGFLAVYAGFERKPSHTLS